MAWFKFLGGKVCCATNYILTHCQPECPGTDHLCAIQSVEIIDCECGRSVPLLYEKLICEIGTALNDREDTVNVLLKD